MTSFATFLRGSFAIRVSSEAWEMWTVAKLTTSLGPIFKNKLFSKMNQISQPINENCLSCQNIGQISIWMILVASKCSIYDVKHISLIFRGPQTLHITTIFEEILQLILFHANKSACHIIGKICDTFRIPRIYRSNEN